MISSLPPSTSLPLSLAIDSYYKLNQRWSKTLLHTLTRYNIQTYSHLSRVDLESHQSGLHSTSNNLTLNVFSCACLCVRTCLSKGKCFALCSPQSFSSSPVNEHTPGSALPLPPPLPPPLPQNHSASNGSADIVGSSNLRSLLIGPAGHQVACET